MECWNYVKSWFECKPQVVSVGALLRQLTLYTKFIKTCDPGRGCDLNRGYVVTQTISDEAKKIIREQGYGVIVVPEDFADLETKRNKMKRYET
jgi:hypothetical protein